MLGTTRAPIDIGEYHLDLIPFDGDLISLELESCFVEYKLDGDATLLHSVAQSLLKVQSFYGLIPNIKSIGPAARTVCSKMLRMRMEQFDAEDASAESEIDTLVLIDREVDLVSPLVTPLTYEGLIDELIGISNGYIKVDRSLIGDDKDGSTPGDSSGGRPNNTKVSVALNSNDQLTGGPRPERRAGLVPRSKARNPREVRHVPRKQTRPSLKSTTL